MSWWNLGGKNPNYKEFIDEHPNKTLIGMWWAFQWRVIVLLLILEVIVILVALIFGGIFGGYSQG